MFGLAPGSDWDLRLLLDFEHRETLALDSGFPARLVFLPFMNCLYLYLARLVILLLISSLPLSTLVHHTPSLLKVKLAALAGGITVNLPRKKY